MPVMQHILAQASKIGCLGCMPGPGNFFQPPNQISPISLIDHEPLLYPTKKNQ